VSCDKEKTIAEQEELDQEIAEADAPAEAEETVEDNPLQKSYDELYDKHLRTLAEYDNYKRRTQKEKDELYTVAQADTIMNLLPVIDNLERAVSAAENSPLSEGVQMVLKQFMDILEKMGVSEIEAVGQPFDPNLHNAVMHVEDENLEEGMVAEEFAKGYKLKDRVLRHSMVKVAN